VVNNCAAAALLVLSVLAADGETIVSRGELVEIGGAFRIPDILIAAGVELVEVGTTNRTRLADYAAALGPETALLLKVLPSNFRISGFVAAVPPEALADLGRRHGVPLLVDEGSGLLRRHPAPQLRDHPSIEELVAAGCDLVAASGDKLLGGPQAGIVVGRQELVARLLRHPLYRALRPDRMQLAALAEVLRAHLRGEAMPLERMWPEPGAHRARLERLAASTGAEIVPANAYLGGGSAPESPIPGEALALPGVGDLDRRLRLGEPSVVGYVRDGKLVLDLRTVAPEDDEALLAALQAVGAAR
jgi:L-seryl-tRNA(Ser) seleniumtransferase